MITVFDRFVGYRERTRGIKVCAVKRVCKILRSNSRHFIIRRIDDLIGRARIIHFDGDGSAYDHYSLLPVLILARASLECALLRKERRGAHLRSDCPEKDDDFKCATVISYRDGVFELSGDREGRYES